MAAPSQALENMGTQPRALTRQDRELLAAMPLNVDLDAAQVSVQAHVPPAVARTSLHKLVRANKIEKLPATEDSARPRFRRTVVA